MESLCCHISVRMPANLTFVRPRWTQKRCEYFSEAVASEIFHPYHNQGQSHAWRENSVYHVSTHSEPKDYLQICSQTGGAGEIGEVGEIRTVPSCAKTSEAAAMNEST